MTSSSRAKNNELSDEFTNKIDAYTQQIVNKEINVTAANKSIELNNYFVQHKTILAGYTPYTDSKPDNIIKPLVKKILL